VITPAEFDATQSTFSVQQSTVKSAQIALDRAKQNLAYTSIYSPIDGVIVERNVDVGQTVAASLSAPQLFLIANDLSEMQILASVDESDIGQIKNGQSVQFTVQSYPKQQFSGNVKQVRLQSTTTDNVVNYTAVISVKNQGDKLLPGMTATVQFTTASATDVLTVPNAALRIKPTAAMTTEAQTSRGAQSSAGARQQGAPGQTKTSTRPAQSGSVLWYVGDDKTLHMARVTTGITNGQQTEVTSAAIKEGTQVVVAVTADEATAAATTSAQSTNPFQPSRPPGGGRIGGGPGR
jgi:HlyD family secretion protein